MDFKGIQVTIAKMAQALIDGRIDCKTAGRLAVDLQMMSKLLWLAHRQRQQTLPRIHGKPGQVNTDNTDSRALPNIESREHGTESHNHNSQPDAMRDASDQGADRLTVGPK